MKAKMRVKVEGSTVMPDHDQSLIAISLNWNSIIYFV